MTARTGDSTAREVRINMIRHLTERGYTLERMAPLLGMKDVEKIASLANKAGVLVKREEKQP